MAHLSMFSMGADIADVNNDGFPDIFTTDMLPADDYRLKTVSSFETYDVYQVRLKNDYYHQFMRNMLQVNNQDGTFSEVGQLAGVDATDWSWGALIADFNNDLNKDIFVCNGIYRDVINQDFVEFLGNDENIKAAMRGEKIDFRKFVDQMPSVKLSNYMFANNGKLKFNNMASDWGLDEPGFSNGAAYGDIDNDGDLDLVVNNVNQELFVYKNQTSELKLNNFITASFKGPPGNYFGIGASMKVYVKDQVLYFENMPMRGFQSSMDYKMVIGLGDNETVDSIYVTWPDNKVEILKSVKVNQGIIFDYTAAKELNLKDKESGSALLQESLSNDIVHVENSYNEFDHDRLLYHMQSTRGPSFAVSDINNDGLDDFYLGGSIGNPGSVFIQTSGEKFTPYQADLFRADSLADDVDAAFFDFDNDKDLDLYIVSGGTEHNSVGIPLLDRLYENQGMKNGKPVFTLSEGRLPSLYQSGSCVRPADIDNDGDLDLFIGNRVLPSYYGLPCDQTLLINDGKGNFKDLTVDFAPQFKKLGLVTDAQWFDYDDNGFLDLIIVGEWMPVTIFKNDGKKFTKVENVSGLEKSEGLWNSIKAFDIDEDGDDDFILGNLGQNSKMRPTVSSPVSLYVNDFDQNGSVEPIFTFHKDGEDYPMVLRPELIEQMSSIKRKFIYHKDYAGKSVKEIFDTKLLERATRLTFYEPNSLILINNKEKGFERKILPQQAQFSPIYGICMEYINKDKKPDLIIGGNLFAVKPEIGRYDALNGLVLLNDNVGNFIPTGSTESGLKLKGEVRHISAIRTKTGKLLAFVRNNDSIKFYKVK
jgi:enediyne biosynthesis protein E4